MLVGKGKEEGRGCDSIDITAGQYFCQYESERMIFTLVNDFSFEQETFNSTSRIKGLFSKIAFRSLLSNALLAT